MDHAGSRVVVTQSRAQHAGTAHWALRSPYADTADCVCVESTLRDGYHLEYFAVLLEDATHQAGPAFLQQATVYNVEKFFGWVCTTTDFCAALPSAACE